MDTPDKRNSVLDFLFGGPPTPKELAARLAHPEPRWASAARLSLGGLVAVLMTASFLGLTTRIPIVGPWMHQERGLIGLGACVLIIMLDWWLKKRTGKAAGSD